MYYYRHDDSSRWTTTPVPLSFVDPRNRDFPEAFRKFPRTIVRETRGGKPTAVDLRKEFPRENFNDGTRSWREQETKRKRERRKKKGTLYRARRRPLARRLYRTLMRESPRRGEARAETGRGPRLSRWSLRWASERARDSLERGCSFAGPCARRTPFLLGERKACQASSRRCIRDGFP